MQTTRFSPRPVRAQAVALARPRVAAPWVRAATLSLAVGVALCLLTPRWAGAQTQAPGLRLPHTTAPGGVPRLTLYTSPRWGARLDLMRADAEFDATTAAWSRLGWQLLGDYRFASDLGLRATGGLYGQVEGSRLRPSAAGGGLNARPVRRDAAPAHAAPASDARSALPYVGVGYDTTTRFRDGWGGWGLSADLGLTSRSDQGAAVRLGNSGSGADWLGGLHLSPVLQIGLSYSF